MNRRKFIIVSATAGAAAAAIPWGYKEYEEYKWKSHPLIHPVVLMRFCDEATVRKIGQEYRNSFPSENSKDQLTSLILTEVKVPLSGQTENDVNEAALKIQGEKDFKKGQLVILKGWVLSRTEARQCALLSFS
jgi:hypothetical protein